MGELSHLDDRGRARMVDVAGKPETERVARAEARVIMAPQTLAAILDGRLPKGDVVATARLAGIMAAKRTHELIPLCHPLSLSYAGVEIEADAALPGVRVTTETRLVGRTGVEMEALVAASIAALAVYDMCKAIDRGIEVTGVRLLEKEGGASGHWRRPSSRGSVVSVNVAAAKGVRKEPRPEITLVAGHGVEGDGHAGPWHRQVSLLARESIATMQAKGLDVGPGDFAENVTTEGLVVAELPIGTLLRLGGCLVELTQIGKVCHDHCAIYRAAGDCVMPREGIFVRVLTGGPLRAGDEVVVVALGQGAGATGAKPDYHTASEEGRQ